MVSNAFFLSTFQYDCNLQLPPLNVNLSQFGSGVKINNLRMMEILFYCFQRDASLALYDNKGNNNLCEGEMKRLVLQTINTNQIPGNKEKGKSQWKLLKLLLSSLLLLYW